MKDNMEIVNYLEDPDLLNQGITETIENEVKKTKRWISLHVIRYIKFNFIGKYIRR